MLTSKSLTAPSTYSLRSTCHLKNSTHVARLAVVPAPRLHTQHRQHTMCVSAAEEDSEASSDYYTDAMVVAEPRSDDCLPDSLTNALEAASQATSNALDKGVERAIVEILLPEFWDPLSGPVYAEEGDQQRFWKLTRRFLDDLVLQKPGVQIRAIYPDAGVAAMLKNQWTDAPFLFSSLNDRKPVQPEDEIIVLASPDPPGLDSAVTITRSLQPGQCLVMFNPRLASGDVGVGLNIRRLRENFLSAFTTTYSLRPVGDVGSVFRSYPSLWKVFVTDPDVPGRYKLVAEKPYRPAGEDLDLMLMNALGIEQGGDGDGSGGEGGGGPGVLGQIGLTLSSLQRFMRSLSQ